MEQRDVQRRMPHDRFNVEAFYHPDGTNKGTVSLVDPDLQSSDVFMSYPCELEEFIYSTAFHHESQPIPRDEFEALFEWRSISSTRLHL